jgi:hypothetical protein
MSDEDSQITFFGSIESRLIVTLTPAPPWLGFEKPPGPCCHNNLLAHHRLASKNTFEPSNAMEIVKRFLNSPCSSHDASNNYLIGLRGFYVIQSFLFTFLQVFAPSAVAHTPNAIDAPSSTLHKALKFVSILFWNDGIIYSAFILLSARTICLPFMTSGAGSKSSIAGSVFRRGLRLWLPVAVALAISTGAFRAIGYHHVDAFAEKTTNLSILTPYKIDNALIYFNAVFNLFWVTTKYSDQAGSYAFPGQMTWVINVIYQQR